MYICPICGSELNKDSSGLLECPSCGWGTEAEYYDEEYEAYSSDSEDDDIPECCKACGGPYPDCMTSCKIFDD